MNTRKKNVSLSSLRSAMTESVNSDKHMVDHLRLSKQVKDIKIPGQDHGCIMAAELSAEWHHPFTVPGLGEFNTVDNLAAMAKHAGAPDEWRRLPLGKLSHAVRQHRFDRSQVRVNGLNGLLVYAKYQQLKHIFRNQVYRKIAIEQFNLFEDIPWRCYFVSQTSVGSGVIRRVVSRRDLDAWWGEEMKSLMRHFASTPDEEYEVNPDLLGGRGRTIDDVIKEIAVHRFGFEFIEPEPEPEPEVEEAVEEKVPEYEGAEPESESEEGAVVPESGPQEGNEAAGQEDGEAAEEVHADLAEPLSEQEEVTEDGEDGHGDQKEDPDEDLDTGAEAVIDPALEEEMADRRKAELSELADDVDEEKQTGNQT